MAVFLVTIIILVLLWPNIKRWAAGFMARRAEDFIRNATGMPPRPGSRRAKRESRRQESEGSSYGRNSKRKPSGKEPLIPKEYAEDVEFVETVEYSSAEVISDDGKTRREWHESQVSDAEWTEIREKGN